jgi:hypothetical protein
MPQPAPLRTPPFDDKANWSRAWALYFTSTVSHSVPLPAGQLLVGDDAGGIKPGDLTGDVSTAGGTVTTLAASGVTAGTYGDAAHVAEITVDAKGRVTAASAVATGAITSLTGAATATGPGAAVVTLAASGVTAATYGDATHVAEITVDAAGRITAASSVATGAITALPAVPSGGAVVTTAPALSSFGYTSPQAAAILTLLNNIRTALVANGIMS